MRKMLKLTGLALLALPLCAFSCNGTQQQQAAQASLQAATVLKTAQQAEISAYKDGLISAPDHQLIEQKFQDVAGVGKTVDSCISSAGNKAGVLSCIDTAITEVDTLNSQGQLGLKSSAAKQTYSVTMTSIRTVLASIEATLGGTPTPAPAPAS